MGTTLDALQTGSASFVWVVAIEGFNYLFTDGDPAAAVTAWAGTEWDLAAGGLTVRGDWSQRLDPWDPFPDAGTITLSIQPDDDDRTAPMFKNLPRAEDTFLDGDIDANDTTISVDDTGGLTSPVFIGTERVTFTGSTATTLTGCGRGRKAPFGIDGTSFRFGRAHRSAQSEVTTQIRPVVGDAPRVWVGRQVGLWMHRVVNGVLDVQAEAHLSFAGRIVSVSDSAENGCTVIEVEHLAEAIRDAVIGRDTWQARVGEGVVLKAGDTINYFDSNGTTTKQAVPLVCTVGASGYNEFEPGRYTATEFASVLNAWLAGEKAASRIYLDISIASPVNDANGQPRTRIRMTDRSGASGSSVIWKMYGPGRIIDSFLGFDGSGSEISGTVDEATTREVFSSEAPIKFTLYHQQAADEPVDVEDEVGAVVDQLDNLPQQPAAWAAANGGAGTWGIFRCGDFVFAAQYSAGALTYIRQYDDLSEGPDLGTGLNGVVRYGSGDGAMVVRQMFVVEGRTSDLIIKMFASTGASGYNHADYDALPAALGLGIPWSLLGTGFVRSVRRLAGADVPMLLVVDKPMKFADVVGDDLIIRRAGLIFKNGAFKFARYWTPGAAASADHELTEENKAAPVGTMDPGRSATRIDTASQRCTVKLRFNRRSVGSDEYRDVVTLQDRTAVDDGGGDARLATLSLRNSFARLGAVPDALIQELASSYLANLPLFSRPLRLLTRSVSPEFFEGCAPGDIVDVTDNFARDPDTGARGLTARRGVIVSHRYDWGGASAGDPSQVGDMGGEVTIMLLEDDRSRPYCPAAQVDDTVSTGGFSAGYNSGTTTLRCYANEHSESALGVVDAARFESGDEIRIIEIDPSTPAGALSWTRTISSVSGSDIVLASALSAPAWDATKKYRIIPADYASAGRFQANTYQADPDDALIVDTDRAHHYAASSQFGLSDPDDADLPERYSSADIGDGKPYHVGQDRAIARALNNLRRSKTRRGAPSHLDSFHTVDEASNWDLLAVQIFRVRDTGGVLLERRTLDLTARWRSSTGGTSKLRITISPLLPTQSTTDPDDTPEYSQPYRQSSEFSTTSTTYRTDTFSTDVGIAGDDGLLFVFVEGKTGAQFSGFEKLAESATGAQVNEWDWCANDMAPQADFYALATNYLRGIYRRDTKLVFSHLGTTAWPTSTLSSRNRWRFRCHTGPRAARLAVAWLVAPSTLATTESYSTFQLTNADILAATSVVAHIGASDAKSTIVPLSDCWFGVSYIDVDPSTPYEARFSDYGGSRVVAACVWEVPSSAVFTTPFVSLGAPIYSEHRTFLHTSVTDMLNEGGSHLFNWSADVPGVSARSTTSTTAKNIYDDATTTVSSTTPGVVLPIANCKTLAQTGVPVVFAVYGSKTGAGNLEVAIKDDTGTAVITCTVTATSDQWTTVTGTLPASDTEKYDVHYRVTAGLTTGEVKAFSCYQLT